jgi:hypothetical protein
MIQLIIMDEVPHGPAHQASDLSFVVWYRFEPEVLKDRFPPVCVEVGRSGNGCYFHLGLPGMTSCPARVPRSVSGVGVRPPSPGRVPGAGARLSSSSRMDGLMRYYMNMPELGEGVSYFIVSLEDMMKFVVSPD